MKTVIILALALGCVAIVAAESMVLSSSQDIPKESKIQPKEVVLGKDSQSDKYGEVPFNHETHSLKNYSIDGTKPIPCVDCHHTDQPASTLKPPLKTSERDVVLTTAVLEAADAKPVKSCRVCHLQVDDDSAEIPTIIYPDKTVPSKLTNELAYHNNCNLCHDAAIAARPELKGKIPGSKDCLPCHKPIE
ncbi:MAG TPA: cytochrome c3 family protein [Pyrinomonadaceae bacterium]|nr:cytochrome c3 family protein [Pyrinomonadaceae bacterium]